MNDTFAAAASTEAAEIDLTAELKKTIAPFTSESEQLNRPAVTIRTLDQFNVDPESNGNSVLGNRFLCRGGAMLFVGPSGIGKSSWVMQAIIRWSVGQPHFGIASHKPLRVLVIQAENDDGDVAEMRDGIFRGLQLSKDEQRAICERIKVVCESSAAGDNFIPLISELVKEHKPDLIVIDPLFAYIGGAVDQETCSRFLRNGLNPILHEHQCGLILVHHTNKPSQGKEKSEWQAGDFAYLGSGTSELANWARAVIALRSIGSHDVFELVLGKRGKRAGIVNEDGEPIFSLFVKHGRTGICWENATADEAAEVKSKAGKKPAATIDDVLRLIPLTGSISQSKLFNAGEAARIGKNRFRDLLAELIEDKRAHVWLTPRPGTNPAKSYSRKEQELINE